MWSTCAVDVPWTAPQARTGVYKLMTEKDGATRPCAEGRQGRAQVDLGTFLGRRCGSSARAPGATTGDRGPLDAEDPSGSALPPRLRRERVGQGRGRGRRRDQRRRRRQALRGRRREAPFLATSPCPTGPLGRFLGLEPARIGRAPRGDRPRGVRSRAYAAVFWRACEKAAPESRPAPSAAPAAGGRSRGGRALGRRAARCRGARRRKRWRCAPSVKRRAADPLEVGDAHADRPRKTRWTPSLESLPVASSPSSLARRRLAAAELGHTRADGRLDNEEAGDALPPRECGSWGPRRAAVPRHRRALGRGSSPRLRGASAPARDAYTFPRG